MDREKIMSALDCRANDTDIDCRKCDYYIREDKPEYCDFRGMLRDALALLKEQEKKEIILHKKHVITWKRDDEFTMRKLYEAICETLLDEGELFIARTDDHEKVDFVFYVAESR